MTRTVASSFGSVLREMRKEAKLTQEALGLEADLQRKYISSLELGRKEPSLSTVLKIARALNVPPGDMVNLVDVKLKVPQ